MLLIDNTAQLGGAPGLHALIIGVSTYPFLTGGAHAVAAPPAGLQQLTSTAATAWKVVEWLRAPTTLLPVPLATCRVLLSPAPADATLPATPSVTVAELITEAEAWRQSASTNADNLTFFYFAGHGVQRGKDDAVMCLQNFGRPGPLLDEAVAVANVYFGMSPSPTRPNMARTQLYFVDACRTRPEEFSKFDPLQARKIWDTEIEGVDDRCAPIFFASFPNTAAAAFQGQTLFSRAFLNGVAGGAGDSMGEDADGDPQWGVSIVSLHQAFPALIDDANRLFGADQHYTIGGQFTEATICRLIDAPMVDVSLEIDPAAACTIGQLRIVGDRRAIVAECAPPVTPHPFTKRVPAGSYTVELSFAPHGQFQTDSRNKDARAPRAAWRVKVV